MVSSSTYILINNQTLPLLHKHTYLHNIILILSTKRASLMLPVCIPGHTDPHIHIVTLTWWAYPALYDGSCMEDIFLSVVDNK